MWTSAQPRTIQLLAADLFGHDTLRSIERACCMEELGLLDRMASVNTDGIFLHKSLLTHINNHFY